MGSRSSAPTPAPKIAPPAAEITGPDGLIIQPAPVLAQQTAQQNYNEYRRQPGQWDYNQTNEDYTGAMNGRYSGYQGYQKYRHMNNPFPWQKRQPAPAPALAPPAAQVQPLNPSPYG